MALRRILRRFVRKLRRIAASDLAWRDKFRYALPSGARTYQLPGGASVALRTGTTDAKVFDEIFIEQVYAPCVDALAGDPAPLTLLDLGAYTGLSALFFARQLPQIDRIVAVEPDPGNFRQLAANLETSGLAGRCTAVHAFAGAERAFADVRDSGNGAWGMRMGPLSNTGTPVVPLPELIHLAGSSAPVVVKCDIEGGERALFLHLRDWEHLVRYIFLELHTEFLPLPELLACLGSSGFHWTVHGAPDEHAIITFCLLTRGEPRGELRARAAGNATMKHVCL
ncbi:MAG TPA: FkbM family methyltransferase [Bryobacteraceae bacterium]|jgi:FkbM family methyltransferase